MNPITIFLITWLLLAAIVFARINIVGNARMALLRDKNTLGLALFYKLPSFGASIASPRYWHIWSERQWREYATEKCRNA